MSITAPPHTRRRLGIFAIAAVLSAGTATVATTANASAPPTISDADVDLAALNVLTFGLEHVADDPITDPCPMLTQEQLGWYMGQNGFIPNFNGFLVDVYFNDTVGEGFPAIDCGVDTTAALDAPDPAAPHYPVLSAANLLGVGFDQFLTQIEGQTVLTPSVPGIGGEIAGRCIEASPGVCILHWHRGDLVITLVIAGGTGDITRARVEPMLVSMIPDVVANLKAAVADAPPPAPTPPATTAVVPATTTPPTSTPATTATTAGPATTMAPPATTAPGGDVVLPAGYTMITDSSGRLTVAVPATWAVDGAALTRDDGTEAPHLVASTDIQSYTDTFDVPGIEMFLLSNVPDTATAVTEFGLDSGCTSTVTEPYSDPVFTGHIGHWTGCGAGSASWHLVVANPTDQSATVAMIVQMAGPQDQVILDTALATFNLLPAGTAPATTAPATTTATTAPAAPTTTPTAPTTTVPG